jgi:hypothetical protein
MSSWPPRLPPSRTPGVPRWPGRTPRTKPGGASRRSCGTSTPTTDGCTSSLHPAVVRLVARGCNYLLGSVFITLLALYLTVPLSPGQSPATLALNRGLDTAVAFVVAVGLDRAAAYPERPPGALSVCSTTCSGATRADRGRRPTRPRPRGGVRHRLTKVLGSRRRHGSSRRCRPAHAPPAARTWIGHEQGHHLANTGHGAAICAARCPAPYPLSMLTTPTPGAQALSMPSSAAMPPNEAP